MSNLNWPIKLQLKTYILFNVFLLFVSCDFFKDKEERIPIARVNESYLFHEDIEDMISPELSKQDSTILVNNFINSWATRQLLVKGALLNLNETKQNEFNKLVEQYKNDLFSKAYLQALVTRDLDTVVSYEEAEVYYNDNKEAFKLNEELIKFRYINLDQNRQDKTEIEKKILL